MLYIFYKVLKNFLIFCQILHAFRRRASFPKCNPLFKYVLAEEVQKLVFFCVSALQIAFIREVMWVPERRQKYFFTY